MYGEKGKRGGLLVTVTFYEPAINGVRVLTRIENECSHDSGVNTIHNCDIEYVHQMQHAFKLCGIGKKFDV